MFVNETFDKKTKPEAEKMIKLITKAFRWSNSILAEMYFYLIFIRNGLEEADWMDNATRRKAEEKVKHR